MTKRSKIEELVSSLQSEMSRVGGKLSGLDSEQNWAESRNNSIEREHIESQEEGTNIMASTAKNLALETNNEEKNSVPPAGGMNEQEVAQQLLTLLHQAGGSLQNVIKPRSWKEKALDQAIPAATTVASVMVAYGAIALIERQIAKRAAKKQLAADNAAQLLASAEHSVG